MRHRGSTHFKVGELPFLITAQRGRKEGAGVENRKRESFAAGKKEKRVPTGIEPPLPQKLRIAQVPHLYHQFIIEKYQIGS